MGSEEIKLDNPVICDFCEMWHSGSCCHPGRARFEAAKDEILRLNMQEDIRKSIVDVLKFRVSNLTTEKKVADLEIERMIANTGTDNDPMWVEMCRQKTEIEDIKEQRHTYRNLLESANAEIKNITLQKDANATLAFEHRQEIERLKKSNVMPSRVRPPLVIEPDETESQLTAERETKERAWHQIDDLKKQLGEAYDKEEAKDAEIERLQDHMDICPSITQSQMGDTILSLQTKVEKLRGDMQRALDVGSTWSNWNADQAIVRRNVILTKALADTEEK